MIVTGKLMARIRIKIMLWFSYITAFIYIDR